VSPPARAPEWSEVLSAFDELVELDAAGREARLGAIEARDSGLRREVERLLEADARADLVLGSLEAALSGREDHDPLGLVGRTVSHFRIVAVLAHGGMGVVYRAEDLRLGRAAALKFPLAASRVDPRARERFLHEARMVAALDHPRLCAIYETVESDGHLFHAMPLYPGETLRARLAREGALPPAAALDIARQIAEGLAAAHQAGIVHRDLKPANVMLLPDGSVKILDFGLAKVGDVTLTGSWMKLGTAAYMAPEQVLGRELDRRTDLWALGVVLFEMATGTRPFAGGHEIAVAHAILHSEPVPPSARRAGIPPALDRLVLRLLEKDPGRRPREAEEVLAALDAIRSGANLPSPPRRRSRRAVVLTLAAVALLGWGGWTGHRLSRVPPHPLSVAVLPFAGGTGGDPGVPLARALADEIRTDLSRLRGLAAPGHLTMVRYQGSPLPLPRIAAEQAAVALLVGSLREAGGRLLLDARLLDSTGRRELWAGRYERPAGDLAGVSHEVARAVAAALRVRLTPEERTWLAAPPTDRSEAYDAYLRARAVELDGAPRDLFARLTVESIRGAQPLYARARDLDPEFALARAGLARSHTRSALAYDTTAARREQARLEAEAALRLRPGISEAHEALATYWELAGDPARAIEDSKLAAAALPNAAEPRLALGTRYARAGRLEDGVAALEEAMRLEPGNAQAAWLAALHLLRLRRDEPAMRAFDRVIALEPDAHMAKVIRGHTYLRWQGTPDSLAAAMRDIPAAWDPDGMATWARYTALRVQRRYAEGLAMLDRTPSGLSRDGLVYQPSQLMRAQLHDALGDRARARAAYAAARAFLRDSVAAHPEDASIRIALGLALAGLGRAEEAVREARRAMELVPVGRNTVAATAFMGGAVEVFARAGESDGAMELLELLFSMPAGREVTVAYLRVWPGFDPLRADPRFARLLERFGGPTSPRSPA
jgi:serine/threonine-protein kinase